MEPRAGVGLEGGQHARPVGMGRHGVGRADAFHAPEDHREVEGLGIADVTRDAREARIEHQDAEWPLHFGGSGHAFCGPLACSNQREIRITPRSSKRRPAICRPIGLPSLV